MFRMRPRLPLRREGLSRAAELGDHLVVQLRNEALDLEIPANDEPEQRRLHASDGQHSFVPGVPTEDRVEASHIESEKPIGALAADGGFVQALEFGVGFDGPDRLADRGHVQIADEDAIDAAPVAEVGDHLVDEQLALPIRIAGVHHDRRPGEQRLDRLQQVRSGDRELPLAGRDREMLEAPLLVVRVVRVGGRELEDVTGAPGDKFAVGALKIPIAAPRWSRQRFGDGASEGGLLGDEEAHRSCRPLKGSVRRREKRRSLGEVLKNSQVSAGEAPDTLAPNAVQADRSVDADDVAGGDGSGEVSHGPLENYGLVIQVPARQWGYTGDRQDCGEGSIAESGRRGIARSSDDVRYVQAWRVRVDRHVRHPERVLHLQGGDRKTVSGNAAQFPRHDDHVTGAKGRCDAQRGGAMGSSGVARGDAAVAPLLSRLNVELDERSALGIAIQGSGLRLVPPSKRAGQECNGNVVTVHEQPQRKGRDVEVTNRTHAGTCVRRSC